MISADAEVLVVRYAGSNVVDVVVVVATATSVPDVVVGITVLSGEVEDSGRSG